MKIKTEAEYDAALVEIERLIDLDPDIGTAAGDRLNALADAIQEYEKEAGFFVVGHVEKT